MLYLSPLALLLGYFYKQSDKIKSFCKFGQRERALSSSPYIGALALCGLFPVDRKYLLKIERLPLQALVWFVSGLNNHQVLPEALWVET